MKEDSREVPVWQVISLNLVYLLLTGIQDSVQYHKYLVTLLEAESLCGIAQIPKDIFANYKANSHLWLLNIPRIIHDPDRVACVCDFAKAIAHLNTDMA